jgi:hypothetical protein
VFYLFWRKKGKWGRKKKQERRWRETIDLKPS